MRRRTFLSSGIAAGSILIAGCLGSRTTPSTDPTDPTVPTWRPANGYLRIETGPDNTNDGSYRIGGIGRDGTVIESFEDDLGPIEEIRLDENQSYGRIGGEYGPGDTAFSYYYGYTEYRPSIPTKGILHRKMPVYGASKLSVDVFEAFSATDSFRIGWGYRGANGFAIAIVLRDGLDTHMRLESRGDTDDLGLEIGNKAKRIELVDLDWNKGSGVARIIGPYRGELVSVPFEFEPPTDAE